MYIDMCACVCCMFLYASSGMRLHMGLYRFSLRCSVAVSGPPLYMFERLALSV